MTRHRIHLYHDPETSESAGEWDTMLSAICESEPHSARSELMSNGIVLARANETCPSCSCGAPIVWAIMPAGVSRIIDENTLVDGIRLADLT